MTSPIRTVIQILAGLMIALGIIWILQGVNILPGSFMTGQIVWAWRGAAVAAAGILLFVLVHRKRR
jgi:hypothetical protein